MSSPFLKEFNPEIMAPAGNWASLTAAAQAGAGSVYLGVGNLNMRAHAAHNFSVEDLPQIVAFCRQHNIRSYLTVNTIFYDQDLPELTPARSCKRSGHNGRDCFRYGCYTGGPFTGY